MDNRNISDMVQRTLSVFLRIGESGVVGTRPGEIAKIQRLRADQVTRCLSNLCEAGIVEEHAGAYRVTPRVGRIATVIMRDIHVSRARLAETEQRYLGT